MLAIPKDLAANPAHLVRPLEGGHVIRYQSNASTQATQFLVTQPTLVYVASGCKKLRPHGSRDELSASAGELVALRSGTHVMSELVAGAEPYTSIILCLDRSWVSSIVGETSGRRDGLRANITPASPAFVAALQAAASTTRVGSEAFLVWGQELLASIRDEGVLELLATEADAWNQEPEGRLTTVMREHCLSPLAVPEYAALCAMSLSTFKRVFRRSFGVAPGEWLLGVRLQHAKTLLLQAWGSVTDICYESGFSDLANFSRVFRQRFGMPPSKLRAQNS